MLFHPLWAFHRFGPHGTQVYQPDLSSQVNQMLMTLTKKLPVSHINEFGSAGLFGRFQLVEVLLQVGLGFKQQVTPHVPPQDQPFCHPTKEFLLRHLHAESWSDPELGNHFCGMFTQCIVACDTICSDVPW